MMPRKALPLMAGLALLLAASSPTRPLVQPASAERQAGGTLSQAEIHHFAHELVQASSKIADLYANPIEQHQLAAHALAGLHRAAGLPLPRSLKSDLSKALRGTDLFEEAVRLRKALGDVPALRGENTIRISLQSMVAILDPYSTYVPESPSDRGLPRKPGVGLTLGASTDTRDLIVKSVSVGGPAAEQGIRPGDFVLELDNQPIRHESPARANELLVGEQGSTFTLLVQRGGQPARLVRLTRRPFLEDVVLGVQRLGGGGWDHWLDRERRIALVRLGYLREGAAGELHSALVSLRGSAVRGLVLDLRDCPGGLLDESTSIVQLFIRSGIVAKIKYRDDEETVSVFRQDSDHQTPLVALIGPETSGGGELIAAALQDHARGVLAGQRTRGKASIQRTPNLGISGPHTVRITAGYFYRSNGKNLHRHPESRPSDPWGVSPSAELEIRLTATLRQQLRDWRLLSDLRLPESRERLPLDDPSADPVLDAGRRYLEGMLK
jgi:carboxyl-terminal processing protease